MYLIQALGHYACLTLTPISIINSQNLLNSFAAIAVPVVLLTGTQGMANNTADSDHDAILMHSLMHS